MALQKSIDTNYGVAATYHNVSGVAWEKGVAKAKVQIASYVDLAARQAPGGIPLGRVAFEVDASAAPPTLAEAYAAIKLLPDWADASDV